MKSLLLFALLSVNTIAAPGAAARVEVLMTLTSGDTVRVHQVSPSGIVPRTFVYKGGEARLREDTQGGWVTGTLMGPGEQFKIRFSDGRIRTFADISEYNVTGWVTGE